MKTETISLFTLLIVALSVSGCFFKRHRAAPSNAITAPNAIVTPDMSFAAKVVSVNNVGRFVVLGFPPEQMPKMQQTLFIYRAGLKVAEVKVTGPQQESNIVADLVSGEAKVGDTVRDQ
jgi:hypothetical protein